MIDSKKKNIFNSKKWNEFYRSVRNGQFKANSVKVDFFSKHKDIHKIGKKKVNLKIY